METYLGHDAKYWLELEKKARELNVVDFIEEIVSLRGKVNFYESRIEQLANFMKK